MTPVSDARTYGSQNPSFRKRFPKIGAAAARNPSLRLVGIVQAMWLGDSSAWCCEVIENAFGGKANDSKVVKR